MEIDNKSEVIEAISLACWKAKGKKNFAKKCGVTPSFISAILLGNKAIPAHILERVGYTVSYVKVADKDAK